MSTTNMNLSLPTVSVTTGPTYATMLNAAFTTVDSHDHTSGKGVQIPVAAFNINANLAFNSYAITAVSYLGFSAGTAPSATTAMYVDGSNNLYYKNGSGTAVQITSGGSLAATGSGVITYVTPGSYPYSITTGNAQQIIGVTTTAARTLNLPSASNAMFVQIKDISGNAATYNITITPNGSDNIDGSNSSITLTENYSCRGLISDGSANWYII